VLLLTGSRRDTPRRSRRAPSPFRGTFRAGGRTVLAAPTRDSVLRRLPPKRPTNINNHVFFDLLKKILRSGVSRGASVAVPSGYGRTVSAVCTPYPSRTRNASSRVGLRRCRAARGDAPVTSDDATEDARYRPPTASRPLVAQLSRRVERDSVDGPGPRCAAAAPISAIQRSSSASLASSTSLSVFSGPRLPGAG